MSSKRSAVCVEIVAGEQAGRRIDNFLLSRLKDTPRSLIYKLLRSGQVRVNGSRVKPDYRLLVADEVRIPPLEVAAEPGGPVLIPVSRIAELEATLLYEDENFLIVDKPAGVACHAGSGLRYGIIEIARQMRPHVPRLDLAHRLDRDTSGCLVLCKGLPALRDFHALLRQGGVDKRYLALLRGRLPAGTTSIRIALGTARGEDGERRSTAHDQGKLAETRILWSRAHGPDTLAELHLVTGRMHQIRAHAQLIGHPLAGDQRYGDADYNAALAEHGLQRLFLHATRVRFTTSSQTFDFNAPLPAELERVLASRRSGA